MLAVPEVFRAAQVVAIKLKIFKFFRYLELFFGTGGAKAGAWSTVYSGKSIVVLNINSSSSSRLS